ncbi:hypothetical protein Nepgr_031211 [Nepenthes gracilis]|uniref:Leucine-rich repeat-containing N-terminal plant-type domain-containing protein n=1 Tax=Nepenthes gracilis TaxID=150966 RepID=A0AAD3Y4Y5_NEPGR|nr:hypothetical protein Nepgr_031211 [Nepenthes gracilis]
METPTISLLCFSLLLFATTLPPPAVSVCNSHDKAVLLKIKEDFGNPYVLASWKSSTDCCKEWYAVKCNTTTHRITVISLQYDDNLSGHISAAVGDLPYLEFMLFHKLPKLTGTIPQTVAKLKYLQYLWISWTNITGPVPAIIGKIKSLQYINLQFNNLTGSIPPSLSSLPNLGYLDLSRNKLTGSIPPSFGSFQNQNFYLKLSHNQLSGQIPSSLGDGVFNTVDLSRNMLTGDVSFLFGKNKSVLFDIDLSRNMLSFDFSNVEFNPTNLQDIDLNHNRIYGKLPEGLTELPNLLLLNVSYNRLCGQIPVGGSLQSFDQYNYLHNKCLCGNPLPACK